MKRISALLFSVDDYDKDKLDKMDGPSLDSLVDGETAGRLSLMELQELVNNNITGLDSWWLYFVNNQKKKK